MSRSVRHRLARRHVSPWIWLAEPIISPYMDRLRAAAFPDQCYAVELSPGVVARVQASCEPTEDLSTALRRLAEELDT